MMGPKQEAQPALFCEFALEEHVPQDHLLRSIDRFVDLSSIRAHLSDFYSHTGQPSVDPVLLIYHPAMYVYMHERAHAAGWLLLQYPVGAASLRGRANVPRGANANQTCGIDSKEGLPPALNARARAIDEYLETLNDAG